MLYSRKKTAIGLALSVLLLAGCDVSTPSQISVRQIQLKETMKTETVDAYHVDASQVNVIAKNYLKNGRGPLSMTMSYLEGSPQKASAMRRQGDTYKKAFEKQGVSGMKIDYVAIKDASYAGQAVLAYTSLAAEPPKGCGRIPGYNGTDTLDNMEKYDVGCETKTALSRMIVDPSDLMGKAGTPDDEARRQGTVVEKYKAGTQNTKLDGLNASSIGK